MCCMSLQYLHEKHGIWFDFPDQTHSWAVIRASFLQSGFTRNLSLVAEVTSPLLRQIRGIQPQAKCLYRCHTCTHSDLKGSWRKTVLHKVRNIHSTPAAPPLFISIHSNVTGSSSVSTGHLYWNKSLYAWGIFSISTGRGKKWVSFWCFLVLLPSLGEPSLFKAT